MSGHPSRNPLCLPHPKTACPHSVHDFPKRRKKKNKNKNKNFYPVRTGLRRSSPNAKNARSKQTAQMYLKANFTFTFIPSNITFLIPPSQHPPNPPQTLPCLLNQLRLTLLHSLSRSSLL